MGHPAHSSLDSVAHSSHSPSVRVLPGLVSRWQCRLMCLGKLLSIVLWPDPRGSHPGQADDLLFTFSVLLIPSSAIRCLENSGALSAAVRAVNIRPVITGLLRSCLKSFHQDAWGWCAPLARAAAAAEPPASPQQVACSGSCPETRAAPGAVAALAVVGEPSKNLLKFTVAMTKRTAPSGPLPGWGATRFPSLGAPSFRSLKHVSFCPL